ncbi:MAG: glutamine-hydrolyzing carbamoyl-phosphate synthase small subunit [Flavobacteriales bacterium]|nr:glutamine-hydrolyzing carbamoyl-phosphate synthase small subunit [Flavobacteriales bacterium]
MKYNTKSKGIVVLEDGTVFHGASAGMIGTSTGEICFNTGMTGYQEIYTDPSYYGQIMVCATSHIGNYGVENNEVESEDVKISGLICKKFSNNYSRPIADGSLQNYFEENKIVAITDVDSRALVRQIRDKGAMNVIISSEEFDVDILKSKLSKVPSMQGLELSSKVATKEAYFEGDENADYRIAVMDYGTKKNILRCLTERGAYVKVFPMNTSPEEVLAWNPDGIMLSNGPGDPSAMQNTITNIKELIVSKKPIFGICLGHQLLALACGLKTIKMHTGHRGINHPVLNLETGKGEVTSQNHGFVVERESAENSDIVEITHNHLNDNTVAGIRLKDQPAFSVQYHPEASPGPHDSRYLFDNFIEIIVQHKK